MKEQKLLKDLEATQDQELINSFNEMSELTTDDVSILNRALFSEEIEEENDDDDDPLYVSWRNGKMRA